MSDRKYICDYQGCSKAFKRNDHLKSHKLIHTGEKPYICNFECCNKSFAQKGDLISHKRIHTGERPYICNFEGCDKAFAISRNLTNHNRIHTGEKPYICDFEGCDKAFAVLNNLTVHKRFHIGYKSFICNFEGCNKAFEVSSGLKNHMRIHTGEKPYVCNFEGCDKAFSVSSALVTHKRNHTGEKPYVCNFEGCDNSFKQLNHLKNHKISWHTEEGKHRKKKSEEYTAKLLEKEGIDFKREHQVSFSCNGGTFCRIDYLSINKGVIFAIENDEHQHEGYPLSCEVRRMVEVKSVFVQDDNNLPLVWIRYNPDKFNKGENKGKINKKDRVKEIVELMGKLSYESNLPPLSIYYCYYDTNEDESLCVLDDPDFPEDLKSLTYSIN